MTKTNKSSILIFKKKLEEIQKTYPNHTNGAATPLIGQVLINTQIQCQNWREFDTQQKRYAYIIIAYLLIISQVISSISAKKIIKIQLNKNKISKFGIF